MYLVYAGKNKSKNTFVAEKGIQIFPFSPFGWVLAIDSCLE